MKVTTCYSIPIKSQGYQAQASDGVSLSWRAVDDRLMRSTAAICLDALNYCIDVFLQEWAYIALFPSAPKEGVMSQRRAGDLLIHGTKDKAAKYPAFDDRFPYMPAYTRRAVVAKALGIVSSYQSNHSNWEQEPANERGSEPVPGRPSRYELTFYQQERDESCLDKGVIRLKLYDGRQWGWHPFRIALSDAKYIAHMKTTRKMLSPVIDKVRGRYRIRFSFEEQKNLVSGKNPLGYRILAADLGINAPASWCVMTADGTVHAKGVIHLGCDEDRLSHLINRKRMYQQAGKKSRSIYRMVTEANRQLSIHTCRALMDIAVLYNVDCIVFEHLGRMKAKGGRYRERIHLWRANDVQGRVELQAHRMGMRVSRVCAWGTSKLAFDGSGTVSRRKDNYSVCTFRNSKQYNCDLSACQNIGARYFLRLQSKTKGCPDLPPVPQRTYALLLSVVDAMKAA